MQQPDKHGGVRDGFTFGFPLWAQFLETRRSLVHTAMRRAVTAIQWITLLLTAMRVQARQLPVLVMCNEGLVSMPATEDGQLQANVSAVFDFTSGTDGLDDMKSYGWLCSIPALYKPVENVRIAVTSDMPDAITPLTMVCAPVCVPLHRTY